MNVTHVAELTVVIRGRTMYGEKLIDDKDQTAPLSHNGEIDKLSYDTYLDLVEN